MFVAVSINLERIMKFPELPDRALETLLLLVSVLLVSIIGLIPGQGHVALGAELLGAGLVFAAVIAALTRRSVAGSPEAASKLIARQLLIIAATVPFIIGGASVLAEGGGGLYWTVGGIFFAIAGAVANAWVLLVEILR